MQVSFRQKLFLTLFFTFFSIFLSIQNTFASSMDTENGTKVIILNYHKIDYDGIALSVTPEEFESQMRYLRLNGYHSITPEELYHHYKDHTELPNNPVLITFDDGYEDNYTYAYPILKRNGFHATIFVITNSVGTPGYFNWSAANEMMANGINIESHTANHVPLSKLSPEEIKAELTESRKAIKEHTGKVSDYIAYPTGAYNSLVENLVANCGYKAAFTIRYGVADDASDIFALERIPIFHSNITFQDFTRRIHYASNFERFGWVTP